MLAKMLKKATIKKFLAIFTARKVERLLRRMNAPHRRRSYGESSMINAQ